MPKYRKRGGTTAGPLSKYARAGRTKHTSDLSKVKYEQPTAGNQKKQIMSNSYKIAKLAQLVYRNRVWCDWQYFGTMFATIDQGGNFTQTWGAFPLTNFPDWNAVMRKDTNAQEAAGTYLDRLGINMRYSLNNSAWAQFNLFVVTLRKDAAGYDIVTRLAQVPPVPPTLGDDYIENPNGFNIRLNSSKFKVHYARYLTLTQNALFDKNIFTDTAGNPNTTYAKGAVNIRPKSQYRSAAGQALPWTTITYNNQPHHERYFLICYITQGSVANLQAQTGARLDFDQLATTVNDL